MDRVKFKIYKLSELQPNDRFYFVGDRKKTVYTLNIEKPFETLQQKGFWKRYANCRNESHRPGELVVERHLADRQVIFLRNLNDNPGQNTGAEK